MHVDVLDLSFEERATLRELPDRVHDVSEIEVRCRDLMEHRGEDEEVFLVQQRDFDVGVITEPAIELTDRIDASEATAEHNNPRSAPRSARRRSRHRSRDERAGSLAPPQPPEHVVDAQRAGANGQLSAGDCPTSAITGNWRGVDFGPARTVPVAAIPFSAELKRSD